MFSKPTQHPSLAHQIVAIYRKNDRLFRVELVEGGWDGFIYHVVMFIQSIVVTVQKMVKFDLKMWFQLINVKTRTSHD